MKTEEPLDYIDQVKRIHEEREKKRELIQRVEAITSKPFGAELKPATILQRIEVLEEKVRKLTELVGG